MSTSAAIGLGKLATVTASRALVSDGAGAVSASGVTSTELGYVSGVSSAIQTQINTKAPTASPTFTGTITVPVGPGVMKASILGTVSASAISNSDVSAAAAIDVTKLATGTSNQLLGANAAGSANEFKTLATGTTGSDFAITHSAGGVAFNLPDAGASARGAVTTGTQTLAGAKTFSGVTAVSNTTVSNSSTTGALTVAGGVGVSGALNVAGNVTVASGYSVISTGNVTGVKILGSSQIGQGNSFNVNGGNFLTQTTNSAQWINYGPQGGPGGWSTLNWMFAAYDGGSSRTEMSLTRDLLTVTGGVTIGGTTTLATGTGVLHSSSGGVISSSTIVNADVNASAAIDITKLAKGTANQLIGANSGATANEFKSLAVGTSGTDFAIAHSANTVTYNLPDAGASARGAITTGTQTLAGAKTFSGVTAISNTTASTSSTTGALVVSGGLGIGANSTTSGSFLFIGSSTLVPTTAETGTITHNPQQLIVIKQGSTAGASHDGAVQLSIQDSNGANGSYLKVASTGVVISNTTASTSSTTGALKVAGGVGVAGDIWVNGGLITGPAAAGSGATTTVHTGGQSYFTTYGSTGVYGVLNFRSSNVTGSTTTTPMYITGTGSLATDSVSILGTQVATSTSTGALRVAGGIAAGAQIYAAGGVYSGNVTVAGGNSFRLEGGGSYSAAGSSAQNVKLITIRGDGGTNSGDNYCSVLFGARGKCIASFDSSGNASLPSTVLASSHLCAFVCLVTY